MILFGYFYFMDSQYLEIARFRKNRNVYIYMWKIDLRLETLDFREKRKDTLGRILFFAQNVKFQKNWRINKLDPRVRVMLLKKYFLFWGKPREIKLSIRDQKLNSNIWKK